jgi:acyl-CoA synthetase (AMP-forming)/AMP-acid ligase II
MALTASVTTAAFLSDDHRFRAQHTPDDPCWIFGDRTWTWRSAWQDIQCMAGALVDAGVGRGDRIGFLDRNNPAILMAMHAVSLIGAADVVLDPRLAPDELVHILGEADVRLLFAGHDLMPVIDAIGEAAPACVVVVGGPDDELDAWIDAGASLDLQPEVTPDDPCLVLYSSGTTGRPKGIVLTQHNLLVHTRNAYAEVGCGPGDRLLLSNVMFHSGAVFAAASGAAGVITPDLMPDSLLQALAAGVTHAFLTPAAIGRLHEADLLDPFDRLELVLYGCAPMPTPWMRAAMAAWPRTRFVHIYGMTECVGVLTVLGDESHRDASHSDRLRSCGRPIPGVEVRVVDPDTTADVEAGQTGELWFRTEQTTPGYLGAAAATASLIVADGWVRTGDVGRVDDAGYVYVEDRIKDVILINGWNVYAGETERVLAEHPAVLESAVIGVPDERTGEAVKAVVVPRPGHALSAAELTTFAQARLAEHKVPATIDLATSLPRNSLGKVLKRALREPYWAGLERRI